MNWNEFRTISNAKDAISDWSKYIYVFEQVHIRSINHVSSTATHWILSETRCSPIYPSCIIRTFTNDQPLNLDEKYSRIEYRVAENRKFPVKERELKRMKYYSNRANEPIVSHPMELHIENDYDITGCKLFNVHLNTRSFPVGH